MKKILAIILAVLMAASLFACGGKTTTTPSASSAAPSAAASSAAPESAAPSAAETSAAAPSATQENTGNSGNDPMDKVGFYDPNYDYSKNPQYKIQYMSAATGPLYDLADVAFAHWCKLMNCSYTKMWSSNNDSDAFLNNLQTFISQGVTGFIFDPDVNSYMRIQEICKEGNVQWMGFMSPSYNAEDETMPKIHPSVGFDHYWFGQQMGIKLDDYMKTVWKDVPVSEIGYLAVDYSLVGVLHDRTTGAQESFLKLNPDMANQFFIADTATLGPTLDGANTVVTAVLTEQTQYTHWLVSTMFDDIAMGSAAALDALGFGADTACVVTIGGASLQAQWDKGIQDSWQFAMYTPESVYAEAVIGAVYAFLSGQATPETIWPSWVDKSKSNNAGYASMQLPSYWMTHDNYQKLLKWADIYTGANDFPNYPADGITRETFNARMDIPASYAG